MSGYSHPHPTHPAQGNYSNSPQQHHLAHPAHVGSPNGNGNGEPVAHAHQALSMNPHYQFDPQTPQQLQSPYGNAHSNGTNGDRQPSAAATPTSGGEAAKNARLRKACDSCSIRKVKCDDGGVPCRACAALDIPCTFDRPSRRRGPPNKHAEAIKRRRLEEPGAAGVGVASFSSPTSPENVAETLASFANHAVLNAESICPISTLELLVDDFFTYIHPLTPFPHEPSFRAAFAEREDNKNPNFLALLASMVGALVASFPRKPRLHLKAGQKQNLFPNSMSLVRRCQKVANQARGPGYLDSENLNIYDAATSYFLGLAGAYTFNWKQTRLYFGETLTIIRVLGIHKANNPGFPSLGAIPAAYGADIADYEAQNARVDIIQQEISRRIYWCMFVGVSSIQQLGSSFGELLMPPPTPADPHPPLPLELDDEYIFIDHIVQPPPHVVSKLTGFNLGIKIYQTVTPLSTMELAYGIDNVFDWARQKRILEDCLRSVKLVLENAPRVYQPAQEPFSSDYFPPIIDESYPGVRSHGRGPNWPPATEAEAAQAEATKKGIQYEIQKANIFASQLGTRSYIVEKYCNLRDNHERNVKSGTSPQSSNPHPMATALDGMIPSGQEGDVDIAAEREGIVKDLLAVLSSISQVNMEPNGGSFINKIRQIASTLIETPQNRKGPLAVKNEEYLNRFLEVLMKLEKVSPGRGSSNDDGVVDEEEELRHWADLREYQMKFAQAGGFFSGI